MKVAFLVNEVATEVGGYATTYIARAAASAGHEVWYVGVAEIDHDPDEQMRARAHPAIHRENDDLESFLTRAKERRPQPIVLDDLDVLWIRNDSIEDLHERPWASFVGIIFGQSLAARGVTVVNNPAALARAASKLYLHEFPPDIRPRGMITRHVEEVRDFIARYGRSIVKPLYGAKGRNVFAIDDVDDPNLNQIVEAVLEDGYVTAQDFVTGDEEGDLRLFLLEGEPLQENGIYAAFRRVPQGSDLRSNISAGGRSAEATVGEAELDIARSMKDKLCADGMFFVGLDIIGNKVVEINAESPGGFHSVERLTGIDFGRIVWEALEGRVVATS